ncbi:unnamed protein product [Ectocarpus sp. CCAP 1310/34]|nr:unnamed protein product [Ectocarpus sp. CCAP 1310/34]
MARPVRQNYPINGDPGYFYTGGEDGTVCMWNKRAANRPAQFVDVCRSNFSCGPVRCLSVWRTTYSIDLLAACFEVDDGQGLKRGNFSCRSCPKELRMRPQIRSVAW